MGVAAPALLGGPLAGAAGMNPGAALLVLAVVLAVAVLFRA